MSSIFSRPFTYLPARPGRREPSGAGNRPLEEHFVNITLDEGYQRVAASLDSRHKSEPFDEWARHCSAQRVDSDTFLTNFLRTKYPRHSLVVTSDCQMDILNLDGVVWKPRDEVELQSKAIFIPPPRRDVPGMIAHTIRFGAFDLEWKEETFIVYIASWEIQFGTVTQHFILKEGKDETASLGLIMAAGYSAGAVGDSILVFNEGYWEKDYALWEEVQKADWKDVILSPDFKRSVQADVKNFFASEAIYHELAIPWKRGVIFLGPPGNGKTVSLKALIKSTNYPALYVKSFKSWLGEEFCMRQVFARARREAPCLLILEDLDALINNENRSFFLNEIDGLANNDGLLIVGTTNHFERLDPGLADRPSRFDRKYTFSVPNRDERVQYAQYWQRKLKDNKDITFPETLVEKVADLTAGFSFAYLKETFVSTLISLAGTHSEVRFEKVLLKQIAELRKQVGSELVQSNDS